MGMVAILVKWPKTNIIFILFDLLNTPYEIQIQTAQWFLRKKMLRYVCGSSKWVALDLECLYKTSVL